MPVTRAGHKLGRGPPLSEPWSDRQRGLVRDREGSAVAGSLACADACDAVRMPKKKSAKKSAKRSAAATKANAAKASKRSKAWAKRVATKYETPKKIGKTRTAMAKKKGAVVKKRGAVVKTRGGKDGPGVVIEVEDGDDDVDALEDDADDDEQA